MFLFLDLIFCWDVLVCFEQSNEIDTLATLINDSRDREGFLHTCFSVQSANDCGKLNDSIHHESDICCRYVLQSFVPCSLHCFAPFSGHERRISISSLLDFIGARFLVESCRVADKALQPIDPIKHTAAFVLVSAKLRDFFGSSVVNRFARILWSYASHLDLFNNLLCAY